MLSVTRFGSINGHTPTVTRNTDTGLYVAACWCDCGAVPVALQSRKAGSEQAALEHLLNLVLAEHGQIVLRAQNWACTCGSIQCLSVHHRVFRSHERDDRITNLVALCLPCHENAHGRNGKVRPDSVDWSALAGIVDKGNPFPILSPDYREWQRRFGGSAV
jgi:hypothetical protein